MNHKSTIFLLGVARGRAVEKLNMWTPNSPSLDLVELIDIIKSMEKLQEDYLRELEDNER